MKAEYDELMERFNEQSKEYDVLMAEKEEEEQRIFEEMALEFLKNRSARRIQRAWRAYWQRKLERRRAKKSKNMSYISFNSLKFNTFRWQRQR